MDASVFIFVALAVAWAVYLIPKALEHHEEGSRTRSVDDFSDSMRVLARREPVSRREALLVAGDEPTPPSRHEVRRAARLEARTQRRDAKVRARNAKLVAAAARIPADPQQRRRAAAAAARRRLRVVSLILATIAFTVAAAGFGLIEWVWVAAPVAVLGLWLVACRVSLRRERMPVPVINRNAASSQAPDVEAAVAEAADATVGIPAVAETAPVDPDAWAPVPVTLPTYVSKPMASRSVRTIDLDATGVWTSGHSEADSALVRESDEIARAREVHDDEERRAAGS